MFVVMFETYLYLVTLFESRLLTRRYSWKKVGYCWGQFSEQSGV